MLVETALIKRKINHNLNHNRIAGGCWLCSLFPYPLDFAKTMEFKIIVISKRHKK
jgi:hypothetical protein